MTRRQLLQPPQQRIAAPDSAASWQVSLCATHFCATDFCATGFCPIITCLIELA